MIKLILTAAFVMQMTVCSAADYEQCLKNAGAIDPKMRDCQDQEIVRQNASINTVYGQVIAKLSAKPEAVAKVKGAERAWLKFRDANCDVIDAVYGDGSLDRLKHGDCIIDMTKSRVGELNTLNTTPDLGEQ